MAQHSIFGWIKGCKKILKICVRLVFWVLSSPLPDSGQYLFIIDGEFTQFLNWAYSWWWIRRNDLHEIYWLRRRGASGLYRYARLPLSYSKICKFRLVWTKSNRYKLLFERKITCSWQQNVDRLRRDVKVNLYLCISEPIHNFRLQSSIEIHYKNCYRLEKFKLFIDMPLFSTALVHNFELDKEGIFGWTHKYRSISNYIPAPAFEPNTIRK